MKKIFFLICALLISFPIMAQKFLDVYQKGTIIKSIPTSTIDSVGLSGSTMQDRKVNFYRDGQVINSYYVSKVDSIKVYRSEDDPFVYLGIVGFNQELFENPIDILASSTSNLYKQYVANLGMKNGTLLYYAVDHALDLLMQKDFTTPLTSVNLITFTDGLDQGSLMMNGNYMTDNQYLYALSSRIKDARVKGLPINAYSLGLRGSDITDYTLFKNNLIKLASSADKAFEVNSMNDVQTRLQEISNQIISISNRQTFSLKIPGHGNGMLICFTFDGKDPDNSTMYIKGTFNLSDRSLTNVEYHGMKATTGSFVQGTQDGIFVTFTFTGMQREDGDGLIPAYNLREYYKNAWANTWQRNSEFSPSNNTQTTKTYSGTAIMLVLDCSSSMGTQFSNMKNYAQDFISQVANNAYNFKVSAPSNPSATIIENGDVIISWDAVKYAESYDVYRSSSYSSNYTKVASVNMSTSWTDETPLSGNNYYRVYANGHGVTSSASNTTSVQYVLDAPKNVTASIPDDDFVIKVSWDAVKYAETYDVYRSSSSSSGFKKVASRVTATSWIDEKPLNGDNYYCIYANGHGLTSSSSNVSKVVSFILDAPKNVSASIPDDDFVIKVSWDAVKFAESYDVYRSSSSSYGFKKVASRVTATSWIDEKPLNGDNYYCIYANGHGLTSSSSNVSKVISFILDAPKNVSASIPDDDFVIKVSWDAVKFAESYEVYRSSSSSSGLTRVASEITDTSWIDEQPINGKNYYRIYAVGHDMKSSYSSTAYVNYAIDVPTNVFASIDDDDFVIHVSWDAVKHAESYEVYRSNSSSSGFTKVVDGVTSTSWTDEKPLSGNNYYRVCAVGHGLTSSYSTTSNVENVKYVLDVPTNVKALLLDESFGVKVSWDAVKRADSYDVYRSSNTSSSSFTKVASGITATSWVDDNPLSGINYYRVCAVGHGLTSGFSNTTNMIDCYLDTPKNVKALLLDESIGVKVLWDAVKHAESYDVYRSSTTSSSFKKVASGIIATSWVDDKPLSGNNYYRVCAVGHGLTSGFSNTTNVVDCYLDTPKNVTATIEETNDKFVVKVSWDAVKYAEGYNIFVIYSGMQKLVGTVTSSTSFTDQQPPSGNIYYSIVAFGHGLISSDGTSNTVNLSLDSPTNVIASMEEANDNLVVRVSWDAVKNAESYEIYRSGSSSSGFIKVATGVTSTFWVDEKPFTGNNYYRVYAIGHGLISNSSTTISITITNHPRMIDLGLPSGTKWASCNVGASKPEDFGGYYAWGETEEKDYYNQSTYKYLNGEYVSLGSDISGTKYDVAHMKWGGNWVMPTQDDFLELFDNCTSVGTTLNGVNGTKFTSKKNGNSIFLPAAGRYSGNDTPDYAGEEGCYWSSTLGNGTGYAICFVFESNKFYGPLHAFRVDGQSVRPVVRN